MEVERHNACRALGSGPDVCTGNIRPDASQETRPAGAPYAEIESEKVKTQFTGAAARSTTRSTDIRN